MTQNSVKSVLQCVAVCCSVLQCGGKAEACDTGQFKECVAVCCSVLQCSGKAEACDT